MATGPELVEIIDGALFDPSLEMPAGVGIIDGELTDDFGLQDDIWYGHDNDGGFGDDSDSFAGSDDGDGM